MNPINNVCLQRPIAEIQLHSMSEWMLIILSVRKDRGMVPTLSQKIPLDQISFIAGSIFLFKAHKPQRS